LDKHSQGVVNDAPLGLLNGIKGEKLINFQIFIEMQT
jgi:hypothetical protein